MGQNHPPLNEIPTAPGNATSGNIIARMVQGLRRFKLSPQ